MIPDTGPPDSHAMYDATYGELSICSAVRRVRYASAAMFMLARRVTPERWRRTCDPTGATCR